MRTLLLTFFSLFIATTIFAQNPISQGQAQFNAGLGLSSWGLPIYAGLDFGVHQDITVGGEIAHRSFNDKTPGVDYNHSVTSIAGNGNYHFNTLLEIPSNWDLYAGLSLGFYIWNSPNDYVGDYTSGLGLSAQLGGRYYFTEKFGINLEFGGGNVFSGGKIGISLKF